MSHEFDTSDKSLVEARQKNQTGVTSQKKGATRKNQTGAYVLCNQMKISIALLTLLLWLTLAMHLIQ